MFAKNLSSRDREKKIPNPRTNFGQVHIFFGRFILGFLDGGLLDIVTIKDLPPKKEDTESFLKLSQKENEKQKRITFVKRNHKIPMNNGRKVFIRSL